MTKGTARFPKRERMLKTPDFRQVFRRGRSVIVRGVKVYTFIKKENEPSRLGVSVAKKVVPHACDRNRAKRILRDFFRKSKKNLTRPADILIKILDSRSFAENNNLRESVQEALKHHGLLRETH